MRDAARSARIQTSREVAAGYKIDEFPIDIMGLNSTYMSNEEGEAIARDFMYPYLTKNGKNLEDMISQARKMNFLTYCNGTARYLEAEQAVIDLLIKDGFTEQEINSVLSQITVIPFAVESNFDEIKAKTITFIDSNDEEYGKEDKDLLYDVLGDKKHAIIQNGNHITYVYRGNGNHSVQEYLSDDNIVKPALSSVVTTALQNSLNGKETTTTDIIEMVTKYGDETKNIKDLLAEIDKSIGFETAPKYNMMESKIRLELEQAYSKLTNDPFTTTADVREQLLSIKEELKAYSEFVDNIENTPSQQSDGELKLEELDEVRAGIPNIENIRADEAPIKLQEDLAEKITPQNQNIDSHQNEEDYYKQIDDIIKNIDKKFKEYGENIGLSQIKKYLLSGNSAYISGEYRNAITSIPKEVVSKYIEEIDGLRTGVSNQVNVQTLNEDVIMATGTQSVDLSSIQNVIISNINSQISNLEATLNNIRNTLIQDASSLVNNITNRIKYINDLVTQKVKTFTTEQKSSFINKFTTIKQNFIDGANVLKTSMKETYDSIINLFNNLIENIKSKNVVDLDTQKQIYFDQITNAIEYMNVRFIENGKNLGYSQMYEYLQTGNPEYISRAYRDAITSIPREVIYEYFNMTNVNNNQLIMSYPQLRAAQIQQTQSFISSLKNIPSYISSLEEYSNYAYSKYVQFGVEKDFDVLNIREVLTNKYAAYRNVEMKCWGGVNNDVFFNIEIGNETFETPFSNSYKIYVPVEKNSFNSTVEDVFDYLINNNIASNNKIADIPRADGIVLRIYDYNDAMKVIDYINSNPNIPSNVQGIPLAMRYGKVSVAMDGMLSYNSTVIDVLSKYMNVARNPSISGFKNYVSDVLYIINVQRDANLLQNMFLNEWSENRNRFNNVYEYYANKLEVLKLLEYSLDENTRIEDYMKYCESNQNMDNVQKQVEHVYSILNQNERNIPEIQNIEDNNLQNQKIDSHQSEQVYYQQIDSAIKYMDKRFENYGRNKGIEQLKEYVRTGQSKYISREYRDIITAIPKETISKYVKEYDLNQANLVSSSNQQLSTFASLRKNQIQQIQSFINHMNNNRSNFYGNYIRYGVENFDVESIRSYLEQRYASVNNLFIKYWGSGGNYFMNFTIGKETNLTPFRNSYEIYVPVEVNSYNNTVIDVFDYLIKNNIASDNKIARTSRADGIVLRIYDYNDAMKVINYINSDSNIPSNAQGIPLAMRYGKVSLAMDGMLSYNSTVTDVLSYYMNIARNPSIMGFKDYVSDILYKINVERDANLLQNMFLNEWSENRNRFNNVYEYYANKLEVLKLLEYSLDENTRIEDYMKYCESNQNMDNVQKQVEHVYRILNN